MYKCFINITLNDNEIMLISDDLISFDCSLNLKNANLDFTTGIIEQSASLKFYDRGNVFKNLIMQDREEVYNKARVDFYVNYKGIDTLLGSYILEEVAVSSDNNETEIKCIDPSYTFDSYMVSYIPLKSRNVVELLDIAFTRLNQPYAFLDEETKERCLSIQVAYSYVNNLNCKELLEHICSLAMLNIYYDKGIYKVGRCA